MVELRFFAGLTHEEVATVLDVGPATVSRDWRAARIWLADAFEFDSPVPRPQQYRRHHVHDADAAAGKGCSCDFTIFSIVKFFRQCLDCYPNLVDCLFAPRRCILLTTPVGEMVRERRKIPLHRGA